MSILSNVEIRNLSGTEPLIMDFEPNCLQPASYDMRVGSVFRDGQVIDAAHSKSSEQISLEPGEVITMTTLESLNMPPGIAGTAYAINAQSSEGLLVLNPGHVDPGYKGYLTVLAINMRRVPYVVSRKDKIFTIVFQRLDKDAVPAYSNKGGSREDKERDLNKKVVEKSVSSLSGLISIRAPFTRPEDVDRLVSKHWATWATMGMSVVTVVASVVAAIFAVVALLRTPAAMGSTDGANRLSPATAASTVASSQTAVEPQAAPLNRGVSAGGPASLAPREVKSGPK